MRKIVNFVLFVIFMGVTGFMYINPSLTSFVKKTYEGYQKKGLLIEQISPLGEQPCQTELE